jgi:hypothetical protein
MGGENSYHVLLLIRTLILTYIFRSSVFLQAHTNVNLTETRANFI